MQGQEQVLPVAERPEYQRALAELRQVWERHSGAWRISSEQEAAAYAMPLLAGEIKEGLWVLLLDTRNQVLGMPRIYYGSVNGSLIRVGEIFRPAIMAEAAAMIVFHNHPSGDPSPSPEDVAVTRAIVEAGKLLDISVLDHIIIGAGQFVSLKARGLGFDV